MVNQNLMKENTLLTISAQENIKKMCTGRENILFTVAVWDNGKIDKRLYGCNGIELPYKKCHYEIGSITKTFTASILGKAIKDGLVSLEDKVDKYIPELNKDKKYPTLRRLVTHTSGYPADSKEFEEEFGKSESGNLFNRYTYPVMMQMLSEINIEDKDYEAKYSNFGIGVLAVVLEKAYKRSFQDLMEDFLCELNLKDTFIGYNNCVGLDINGYDNRNKSTGNLLWDRECIIGPAGYLFSTADDILKYALAQIEDKTGYLRFCHNDLAPYQRDGGVPIDIGCCWMLIPDFGIMFHNGGTKSFHTIVCIHKKSKKVVIMLCNYMVDDVSTTAINYMVEMTRTK